MNYKVTALTPLLVGDGRDLGAMLGERVPGLSRFPSGCQEHEQRAREGRRPAYSRLMSRIAPLSSSPRPAICRPRQLLALPPEIPPRY